MEKDLVVINKKDILKFKTEGSKLIIKKTAEQHLLQLLDLKDLIDKTIEEVKVASIESGKKAIGEDFKGIVGEKVKAICRVYGDKYETSNPDFVKEITMKRVNAAKIEAFIEENGKLPENTSEKGREIKLSISRIENEG